MKNRKCPCRRHCWDYGDCEHCDIGKAIAGLQKKVDRLKTKNKKLEAENERLTKICDLRQRDLDDTLDLLYKAEDELNDIKEKFNEREARK